MSVSCTTPPEFLMSVLQPTLHDSSLPVSIIPKAASAQIATPIIHHAHRPHVTLTFAQSLDAKIAGKGGQQLALSGKESLVMTHWMRTMHDAIMVGIGTVFNDNPQLNTRHLPPLHEGSSDNYHLPRPIVLDSNLRLPLGCKLLRNYAEGRGRRPWVVGTLPQSDSELARWHSRKAALEYEGARVLEVPGSDGHVSIPAMLSYLHNQGIRSLMVEGGASVIQSFLSSTTPSPDACDRVVDTVIITVAPTFVGATGVGYGENLLMSEASNLRHARTELFGKDAVIALVAPQP